MQLQLVVNKLRTCYTPIIIRHIIDKRSEELPIASCLQYRLCVSCNCKCNCFRSNSNCTNMSESSSSQSQLSFYLTVNGRSVLMSITLIFNECSYTHCKHHTDMPYCDSHKIDKRCEHLSNVSSLRCSFCWNCNCSWSKTKLHRFSQSQLANLFAIYDITKTCCQVFDDITIPWLHQVIHNFFPQIKFPAWVIQPIGQLFITVCDNLRLAAKV